MSVLIAGVVIGAFVYLFVEGKDGIPSRIARIGLVLFAVSLFYVLGK